MSGGCLNDVDTRVFAVWDNRQPPMTLNFSCGAWIIPGKLGQYHICWCLGCLCRQVICSYNTWEMGRFFSFIHSNWLTIYLTIHLQWLIKMMDWHDWARLNRPLPSPAVTMFDAALRHRGRWVKKRSGVYIHPGVYVEGRALQSKDTT